MTDKTLGPLPEPEGGAFCFQGQVYTAEDTLDQFVAASESWAEVVRAREFRIAGLRAVDFGKVQVRKGDKRHYLTVIDLGGFRVAIHMDCTDWAE